MKYLIIILLSLICTNSVSSQTGRVTIQFGDVKPADFEPTAYAVDSSAAAVYLFNSGKVEYVRNLQDNFDIQYTHFARIRLLKKNSFDNASLIKIPLIVSKMYEQKLIQFSAQIYHIENGKMVAAYFDIPDLVKEKVVKTRNGYLTQYKFAFPGIKEGCIIEYFYTIQLPGVGDVPNWQFQAGLPCIWSEYLIKQPIYYTYLLTKRGKPHFDIDSTWYTTSNYGGRADDGSFYDESEIMKASTKMLVHYMAMKNVPDLEKEPYVSSLSNYRKSIDFELYSVLYPPMFYKRIIKSWIQEVNILNNDDDFGAGLKEGKWLDEAIKSIPGSRDNLSSIKAKSIYAYVRDNMTCNKKQGKYLSQPLEEVFRTKVGSAAEINLLLTALCRKAGLSSSPLILSTRENGAAGETYPSADNYNYVICRVQTEGQKILLDASSRSLPFGDLKPDCYNGWARVIDFTFSSVLLTTDSLSEHKATTISLVNSKNGLDGSVINSLGKVEAYYLRAKLEDLKKEDLFNDLKKEYHSPYEISNINIDSLQNTDSPAVIRYDLKYTPGDEDLLYFEPFMEQSFHMNPFTADKRVLPIEMPYCLDQSFVLNLEVPKGYVVDELPGAAHIELNGKDGLFEYKTEQSGINIRLSCTLKLNKAIYEKEDYQKLREFYSLVTKKEAEKIVFKKIK